MFNSDGSLSGPVPVGRSAPRCKAPPAYRKLRNWIDDRRETHLDALPSPAEAEASFAAALNRGDVDGMLAHFDERAVFVGRPGEAAVFGRDALRVAFSGFADSDSRLEVETVKVQESADGMIALLWLVWRFESKDADGEPTIAFGRSPKVMRRAADGRWVSAIDNPFYESHYYAVRPPLQLPDSTQDSHAQLSSG